MTNWLQQYITINTIEGKGNLQDLTLEYAGPVLKQDENKRNVKNCAKITKVSDFPITLGARLKGVKAGL